MYNTQYMYVLLLSNSVRSSGRYFQINPSTYLGRYGVNSCIMRSGRGFLTVAIHNVKGVKLRDAVAIHNVKGVKLRDAVAIHNVKGVKLRDTVAIHNVKRGKTKRYSGYT